MFLYFSPGTEGAPWHNLLIRWKLLSLLKMWFICSGGKEIVFKKLIT